MERNISRHAVEQAILDGDIIEEYPADYPIPSMLIAVLEPKSLHVVLVWDGKRKARLTWQCSQLSENRDSGKLSRVRRSPPLGSGQ